MFQRYYDPQKKYVRTVFKNEQFKNEQTESNSDTNNDAKKKSFKKIAIFNHKGGVSKTTTAFNLGCALARKGKTVIFVDADSQCNLTLYAMGYTQYEEYCEKENINNIYGCLMPAYKSQPKLIEAAECVPVKNANNLFLLPGSLEFTENEVQLGIAMQLSSAFGSMMNLPGALNYLVEKTAQKYCADFVIFDMNPSLSSINQDVLMTVDYFLVPASPDFFSVMAIRSLSRVLPNWEKWGIEARKTFSKADYKLSQTTPKFLGYTINDFNLSRGAPQNSFKKFMKRVSNEIQTNMIPALRDCRMLLQEEKYKTAYENMKNDGNKDNIDYEDIYCLAQISNYNKLIAISNEESIPIFDISLESCRSHGQEKTLKWFKYLYSAFAKRVLELTDD